MKSLLLFIVVVYSLIALFKVEQFITLSQVKYQLDSAKSSYYNGPFSSQDSIKKLCGKDAWMTIDRVTANYSFWKNIINESTFFFDYVIVMTSIIILYVTFIIAYKPSRRSDTPEKTAK